MSGDELLLPSVSTLDGTEVFRAVRANGAAVQVPVSAVRDEVGGQVSVEQFNAAGNGVTDDSAAIQAAVNTGKSVYFPPNKTYRVNTQITVTGQGVRLIGTGPSGSNSAASVFFCATGSSPAFVFSGYASGMSGFRIVSSGMTAPVIQVSSANQVNLRDLLLSTVWAGVDVVASNTTRLSDVVVTGWSGDYGIQFRGTGSGAGVKSDILDMHRVTIANSVGVNTTKPSLLWDSYADTVNMSNCRFLKSGIGIYMTSTAGTTSTECPKFLFAADIEVEFTTGGGIVLEYGLEAHITASYITGDLTGHGVWVKSTFMGEVVLSGNRVRGNYLNGIRSGSRDVTMTGNVLIRNSVAGSGTYAAIHLEPTSIATAITGNVAGDASGFVGAALQSHGLLVEAGAVRFSAVGNQFSNNVTAAIDDQTLSTADKLLLGNEGDVSVALNVIRGLNGLQIEGGGAGVGVILRAKGSDTDITEAMVAKGAGRQTFSNSNGKSLEIGGSTASQVNYMRVVGGATTGPALILAEGSDSNIDIELRPKGTGVMKFGTLTANADAAITGYVTIKLASGSTCKLAVIA
jgi:hypothetical protein